MFENGSQSFLVLTIHAQTRILPRSVSFLFVPLGKACFWLSWTFFASYLLAAPSVGWIALTDQVTNSATAKMIACVGATSIAQFCLVLVGFLYCSLLDWRAAGGIINRRANNDRVEDAMVSLVAIRNEQQRDVRVEQGVEI